MMEANTVAKLRARLTLAEGKRFKPYKDTVGKITIGIGRNLDDVGVSEDEIQLMLTNDITRAIRDTETAFAWWKTLDEVRQSVIVEMVFNMGVLGFSQFKRTINLILMQNYNDAADEMLNSTWALQVHGRADQLAYMMRTGTFTDGT